MNMTTTIVFIGLVIVICIWGWAIIEIVKGQSKIEQRQISNLRRDINRLEKALEVHANRKEWWEREK